MDSYSYWAFKKNKQAKPPENKQKKTHPKPNKPKTPKHTHHGPIIFMHTYFIRGIQRCPGYKLASQAAALR